MGRGERCLPQEPADGPASSRSRALPWGMVAAILRRYVELTESPSGVVGGYSPVQPGSPQGGDRRERLWAATVGVKIRRDPHRLSRPEWCSHVTLLGARRRSTLRLLRDDLRDDLLHVLRGILPGLYSVSLLEVWGRVDSHASWAANVGAALRRADLRATGERGPVAVDTELLAGCWQEVVASVEDHPSFAAAVDYLGHELARCAAEQPGFLGRL